MPLQQKIDEDLKVAMTAKDAARVSALRMLKSALKYSAIEKKLDILSDSDVQQVIQKQIKQRRESITQFSGAGRTELAAGEQRELEVFEAYLPKQLGDAELEAIVKEQAQKAGATSKKDFGRMMKILNESLQGRADAKRVSECLGKILQ